MKGYLGGKFQGEVVHIGKIDPDPKQVRTHVDSESLEWLTESIRRLGVVVPLLGVRSGDRVKLIAGHRRLLAARKAGLKEVPVVYRSLSDGNNLVGQVVENLARDDMSVGDACEALKRLQKAMACSQAVIAKVVGKSEAWVSQTLAYGQLPKALAALVDDGTIGVAAARVLAQIKDDRYLRSALQDARDRGMTEAQAKAWRQNADYDAEVSAHGRPPSAHIGSPDPDKLKAECDGCHKRVSWGEIQHVQICAGCRESARAADRDAYRPQ